VGSFTHDYEFLQITNSEDYDIDTYFSIGNSTATSSGRLSYFFGALGPCISLDTACSSSLAAVHLACQSLELGECNIGLASGVNLILSHSYYQLFTIKKDAQAMVDVNHLALMPIGGYVRSEGCAVVVHKRLKNTFDDNLLAIIVASAINHVRPSNGITAPNGKVQEKLYTLSNALGDLLEYNSLRAIYGGREHPLILGLVKTNIGHTEATTGLAGLIKVVLALNAHLIPAHLHLNIKSTHTCNYPKTSNSMENK